MTKKILASISLATAVVLFTGCSKQDLQPKTITTQKQNLNKKTYLIKKDDPFSKTDLTVKEIENAIKVSTHRQIRSKMDSFKNYYSDKRIESDIQHGIMYLNIQTKTSICHGKIDTKANYSIKENKDTYEVTVYSPYEIKMNDDIFYGNRMICMPDTNEKSTIDMLTNTFPETMYYRVTSTSIDGEKNLNASPKEVLSTLVRELDKYNESGYKKEITDYKINAVFDVKVNNKKHKVLFEIYPYKGGSKVSYYSKLNYEINSNGVEGLSKQEMKQLKQEVLKVLNKA